MLRLVTEGNTTRDIAERLYLSPKTIEGHKTRIMEKTRASSRTDLMNGTYATGSLVDRGWPVGFLLMGLAAWLHARWSVDLAAAAVPLAPSIAAQRARVALIATQVVLLAWLLAYGLGGGFSNDPSLMIALIAMVSVALVRGALAIGDARLRDKRANTTRVAGAGQVPGSHFGRPR